ncbi:mechanosensitive ion channel family protein [Ideonella sp.]|jgi:small-conductance mechanosensitive channel|uniref:mechanosensitive ion channel family protein n=1 Tax=Ideonella sp. TaxID=1929293 RepID=UPI0037C13B11
MFDFNAFFAFAPHWDGQGFLRSAFFGAWASLSGLSFGVQLAVGLATLAGGIALIRAYRAKRLAMAGVSRVESSFVRHLAGWYLVTATLWVETWIASSLLGQQAAAPVLLGLANGGLVLCAIKTGSWVFRMLMQPHDLLKFSLWCIEWFLIASVVLSFLGLYSPMVGLIEAIHFSVGDQVFKGKNIVEGILMAAIAFTLAAQLARLLELWLNRYAERKSLHHNDALFLSRIFGTLLFVGTTIGVLTQSGIEGGTLAAFASALGIGLGFGLQQVVMNFFSGLNILMERTIKLGDFITIDKVTGRVIDLNRQSIVIRDGDGTESLIPNSSITRGTLQNHTLSNPDFRVSFNLELASIENFNQARSIILGVLDIHPRVLNNQPKSVLITGLKENCVTLEVSLWINDLDKGRKSLISELLVGIGMGLREANIRLNHKED